MAEEEFKISKKEADQLREALKKPEFCKLLSEYAQEISDPENKKKYEEELVALEKQRGVDMKYIHPQVCSSAEKLLTEISRPGFVIKSFLKPECTRKIFINMCSSDAVDPATCKPSSEKSERGKGNHWNIPYSLSPPREDLDKAKNRCTVVDVIFHTTIFKKSQEEARFKQLLVDCALEGLERQVQLVVDKSKMIYLKMAYKGVPSPSVIRSRIQDHQGQQNEGSSILNIPYPPLPGEAVSDKAPSNPQPKVAKKSRSQQEKKEPTEPRYTVVHRGEFSMQDYTNDRQSTLVRRPKELLVKVDVPGVSSAAELDVEVFEKRVLLKCKSPWYELDIPQIALAYPVDEEHSSAKFDKLTHLLVLMLPVLPPKDGPLQALPFHTPGPVACETSGGVASVSRSESNPKEEGEVSAGEPSASNISNDSSGSPHATDGISRNNPEGAESSCIGEELLDSSRSDQGRNTSTEVGNTGHCDPVGGVADWTSSKSQACPPFSYRQDNDVVVFCLHTSGVKEGSVVKLFDSTSVQLTYSTFATFYCFHVSFPSGCLLDVDDCSVDVSQDNVVLVLKKEDTAGDCQHTWDKCYVGPDAAHTTEKLFLTDTNVQNVIHNLTDPWKQSVWSEHAEVTASLATDGKQLTLTISDPSGTAEGSIPTATASAAGHNAILDKSQPSPSESIDGKGNNGDNDANVKKHSGGSNGDDSLGSKPDLQSAESSSKQGQASEQHYSEGTSGVNGSKGTSIAATSLSTSESVKVEADGSVFINADENYMRERHKILPLAQGKQDPQPPASQLKLSNDLLFSLD